MAENKVGEYLCVTIRDISVAIATEFVQEVHETTMITRVPGCPNFVLGMINVRGSIIPVLDLWGIRDMVASIKKVVILKTAQGLAGLLISTLVDLMTVAGKDTSQDVPELLHPWEQYFHTRSYGDITYYMMRADELIAATLPQHTRQAVL